MTLGRGNAWLKKGEQEVWADEIEIDFTTDLATATGNVRIRNGNTHIWCNHAQIHLKKPQATFDEAILINDQVVVTGRIIEKLNNQTYEAIEGSYTNCNTGLVEGPEAAECSYSWKIFGKHISLTFEEYAHITDAIIYMQDLPAFYSPYFIFPVKSKRQSGILSFKINDRGALGTSYSSPTSGPLVPGTIWSSPLPYSMRRDTILVLNTATTTPPVLRVF